MDRSSIYLYTGCNIDKMLKKYKQSLGWLKTSVPSLSCNVVAVSRLFLQLYKHPHVLIIFNAI
jgi:hypothetical protein